MPIFNDGGYASGRRQRIFGGGRSVFRPAQNDGNKDGLYLLRLKRVGGGATMAQRLGPADYGSSGAIVAYRKYE